MKKRVLTEKVQAAKGDIQSALQTVYDSLNNGQKKQIVKNAAVKALFDKYGVAYG